MIGGNFTAPNTVIIIQVVVKVVLSHEPASDFARFPGTDSEYHDTTAKIAKPKLKSEGLDILVGQVSCIS